MQYIEHNGKFYRVTCPTYEEMKEAVATANFLHLEGLSGDEVLNRQIVPFSLQRKLDVQGAEPDDQFGNMGSYYVGRIIACNTLEQTWNYTEYTFLNANSFPLFDPDNRCLQDIGNYEPRFAFVPVLRPVDEEGRLLDWEREGDPRISDVTCTLLVNGMPRETIEQARFMSLDGVRSFAGNGISEVSFVKTIDSSHALKFLELKHCLFCMDIATRWSPLFTIYNMFGKAAYPGEEAEQRAFTEWRREQEGGGLPFMDMPDGFYDE